MAFAGITGNWHKKIGWKRSATLSRHSESLGHLVEPSFPLQWSDAEAMVRFSSVWATECAYVVDDWAAKVGRSVTEDDVEPLTWALAELARALPTPDP